MLGLFRNGNSTDHAVQFINSKSNSSFGVRHAWNGGSAASNNNMYYAFGY